MSTWVTLATWFAVSAASEPLVPAPPVPAEYELQWTAPAECPNAEEIRARIGTLREPIDHGEGLAVFDGVITGAAAQGYELVLHTSFGGRRHRRRMHAPSCAELGESTAIVIAVVMRRGIESAGDPVSAAIDVPLPGPAEREPLVASTPAAPLAPEHREADAAAIPSPPRRIRGPAPVPLLRIAALGDVGTLGVVTAGPQLTFGVAWPRARLELYGLYLAPRVRSDPPTALEARFQAGTGGVRACWVVPARALELPLCGGFELGAVRIEPRFGDRRARHRPWGGPAVDVAFARRIGPVTLWLGAQIVARAVGTRFFVEGNDAYAQLPVAVRWLLGVELRFSTRPTKTRAEPDTAKPSRAH